MRTSLINIILLPLLVKCQESDRARDTAIYSKGCVVSQSEIQLSNEMYKSGNQSLVGIQNICPVTKSNLCSLFSLHESFVHVHSQIDDCSIIKLYGP